MADLMEAAMTEARQAAAELIERRVKGLQRVIAKRENTIRELRERLAQYEEAEHD